MLKLLRRSISLALVVSIAGMGLPLPVQAGMLPTESAAGSPEKERIATLLERGDVRAQLEAFGVNAADAKARVDALTDDEAAQLAAKIDGLPAGGDIVGALVLIFIVLLITDILGFTKVFPFTKPIKR